MRKTIHKVFWMWDFDKEEKWLNEMAAKGLSLITVGFCTYTFEESFNKEYTIRLELLENTPAHAESKQYIQFVEETGAEYLGSIMRWVYFRKKKDDMAFNLYSDCESRIKHLNRILTLLGIGSLINIFNGINNFFLYFSLHGIIFNLTVGILAAAMGLILCFGFLHIYKKKQLLQKEKQIFE